jgi:hypothetical protein
MTGRTHRNDRLSWPRRTKTSTCPAVRSAVARSGRQSVGTGADEQGTVPDAHGTRSPKPQIGQLLWLAYGAPVSMQDYAPAAPCLLVQLVDFKRDARRLDEFRQQAIGQGTEVDGAPVHAVRDRQDLLQSAACHAIRHAAFLAVRREATADITLECRPHAGCENRHVRQVVVDEQGQR